MVAEIREKPFNVTYIRLADANTVGNDRVNVTITGDLSASDPAVINANLMIGTECPVIPEIDPRSNYPSLSTTNPTRETTATVSGSSSQESKRSESRRKEFKLGFHSTIPIEKRIEVHKKIRNDQVLMRRLRYCFRNLKKMQLEEEKERASGT